VQHLDLIVYVIWCAGEAGAALDQLLDRRRPLVDRIAVSVPDKAADLPRDWRRETVAARLQQGRDPPDAVPPA
jgi:hypothetical protein